MVGKMMISSEGSGWNNRRTIGTLGLGLSSKALRPIALLDSLHVLGARAEVSSVF